MKVMNWQECEAQAPIITQGDVVKVETYDGEVPGYGYFLGNLPALHCAVALVADIESRKGLLLATGFRIMLFFQMDISPAPADIAEALKIDDELSKDLRRIWRRDEDNMILRVRRIMGRSSM